MVINGLKYKTRVFNSDEKANAFLENNPDWGVLHVVENKNTIFINKKLKVYVARKTDLGIPVKKQK